MQVVMPTPVIAISYQELRDIDLLHPRPRKRKLDSEISSLSSDPPKQNASPAQFDTARMSMYHHKLISRSSFESLNASNTHPAVLSLIPLYNIKYCPKADSIELPKPLTELYNSELCKLDFEDLLEKSNRVFEAMDISEAIKGHRGGYENQSKFSLWFDMRVGRITASKFHQACHTDPASSSIISLIKDVCYGSKFLSKATTWGKNTWETCSRQIQDR